MRRDWWNASRASPNIFKASSASTVKYLPMKSYPAAVTAFTNNQVQLAWFGGFTGVQARRQVPGSDAIAQGAEDVAFKSFMIANSRPVSSCRRTFPRTSPASPSASARVLRPPAG